MTEHIWVEYFNPKDTKDIESYSKSYYCSFCKLKTWINSNHRGVFRYMEDGNSFYEESTCEEEIIKNIIE